MQHFKVDFDPADLETLLAENQELIWQKFLGDRSLPLRVLRKELLSSLEKRVATGKAFPYQLRDPNTDGCLGIVIIQDAGWDSEQYGLRLGRFVLISFAAKVGPTERIELLQRALRAHTYKMIVARVNLLDGRSIQVMESIGAILTDVLVTLRNDLVQIPHPDNIEGVNIDTARLSDRGRLGQLARRIFKVDRFHCDPNLPGETSDELYAKWIFNSLAGYADAVLVARSQETVVGFLTLKIEQVGLNHRYATIDLVGVDPEYSERGVGSLLVNKAALWAKERVGTLYVGTQGANARAIRLYEKNQFRLTSSEATLHLWL